MSITLNDFIKVSEKSKEASVLVAESKSEVSEYSKILDDLGYFVVSDSISAQKLFKDGKKVYGIVSEEDASFYYTLARDYAGGDIHLFDYVKNEKVWITPNRETSAFILIIELKDITVLESKGFDFSVVCDSAYRK